MMLVLVVDDDAASRDALALVLTLEGYAVETAVDAPDAIARLARLRPAVVVCDLALGPAGDGCAVARAARALPTGAGMRLIALSGRETAEARTRADAAGFDDYLVKPVAAAVLLGHIAGAAGA
jgi:CheY-like chemotaxis protein